jgi:AraC-like DNA-binding protein
MKSIIRVFILIGGSILLHAQNNKTINQLIENHYYEKAKFSIENDLKTAKNNEQIAFLQGNLSYITMRLGDTKKGLEIAKQNQKFIPKLKDNSAKIAAFKALAYCWLKNGNLDSAVHYNARLEQATLNSNNVLAKRDVWIIKAMAAFQNGDYQSMYNFYQEALKISTKIHSEGSLQVDYFNLSITFNALKQKDKALEMLKKAHYYAAKTHNYRLLSRICGSMGDLYASLKNDEERKKCIQKSMEYAQMINDKTTLVMGWSHQLEWNLKNNNLVEAEKYGKKALAALQYLDMPSLKVSIDDNMHLLYLKKGEQEEALKHYKNYAQLRIKLLERKARKEVAEIDAKYQAEKKDLIIKNQKSELLAANRMLKINILIAVAILLALVGYLLLYKQKRFWKKNLFVLLRKKENKIRHYQEILEAQENNNVKAIDRINTIYEDLELIMKKDKIFLDPDLDVNQVIKILSTNKKYLYEATSEFGTKNFRSYINEYRIEYSKEDLEKKIINKDTFNISTLYNEYGFKSNATFYRAFKAETGLTPSEFLEELKQVI